MMSQKKGSLREEVFMLSGYKSINKLYAFKLLKDIYNLLAVADAKINN
jgi:hypothetical protein